MANLGFTFDANQHEPRQDFDVLPAGEYIATITESEMKSTKAGNGQYLSLTLEILDGPFKGRKLFDRLNLEHPNRTAVSIAMGTLSAISHAVDVLNVSDSSQLHGRPMIVKVKVKDSDGQYSASNEIKAYKSASAPRPAAAPAAQSAPASAAPTSNAPVWAR